MFMGMLLGVMGCSFGILSAAGVFTVLIAVGLVPRFAGKTHTANKVFLFEEMVVAGTIIGCILSVFDKYMQIGRFVQEHFPSLMGLWLGSGNVILAIFGLFSGMFIGCLALAIAEMLDSIPIFARRVGFRHGLGIAILAMAIGKICGSLFYFALEMH